jgi:hypothetical protein
MDYPLDATHTWIKLKDCEREKPHKSVQVEGRGGFNAEQKDGEMHGTGQANVQVICSGGNARLDLAAEGFRLEHP